MNDILKDLTHIRELYSETGTVDTIITNEFVSCIYNFFDSNYRNLPWRNTSNAYYVLVSEIMLQQTQVSRVIDKYKEFIKIFPTVHALADADLYDVLSAWQGLGYNRRAKYLWECAQAIVFQYNGLIPHDIMELQKLPGLGKATAASVAIFAYNIPALYIETNVRTVYIYSFLYDTAKVSDSAIASLLQHTMDRLNPRKFYNALMDCGTFIKQHYNASRHSEQYTIQSAFNSSLRKVRGQIIRYLVDKKKAHKDELVVYLDCDRDKIEKALHSLCKEKLVCEDNNIYTIPHA